MRRNYLSRIMAMTLSGILAFSSVDLTVFANEDEQEPIKTITAIEELDESITHQVIGVGASEEDIIFPESLSVTVTYQEEKEIRKKIEKDEDEILPEDEEIPEEEIVDPEEGLTPEDTEDLEPADGTPGPEDAKPENPEPSPEPDNPEPENTEPEVDESEPEEEPDSDESSSDEGDESDESLFGMIFPATRVYAASEDELEKEPEETDADTEDEDAEDEEKVDKEGKKGKEDTEDEYEIITEIETITEDITIEDISWKLDEEESSFDKFSSDEAGAKFIYVPAFSDLYEVSEEAEVPTITVTIVKEAAELEYMVLEEGSVRVEGNLPVGTKLIVSPISMSEAVQLLDDPGKEIVFALDISLELDGEEIEPDDTVKVTINPPVDESVLKDDDFELIHIVDEDKKDVMDTEVSSEGELVFETEGFTPFLGAVAAGSYNVEYAQGKSFSQTVKVNFRDASLIKGGESYVVLKLFGNISGNKIVKKDDGTETDEPFLIAESDHIIINGVTDDGEGNTTAYEDFTFDDIHVYVDKGTGDAMSGGSGTYAIPAGFYGIQITTVEGYSVSQGATGSDTYFGMTTTKDLNDAAWTTSRITIENNAMAMTKPFFTIDWQDNRNYADKRPFTTGTSIDGQTDAIKATISLYYKDGDGYHEVADNSPILVSPGSNVPSVEGGPFSWKISYKNLPRYQQGDTHYHWYIKLSDSFYNGNKAYYHASGFNEDGYFEITDSEDESKPQLTMVFTDAVTGTIDWRVGAETDVIPQIPQSGLYSDANNTMKLYQKVGENTPTLVNSGSYSVTWTEGQDEENNTTWNYSITGLPIYASNGDGILYYTVMESTTGTRFKYSYDNGVDSTETDKCLSGHKIYATLIGDGTFSFTKKWYDDNDSDSIDRRTLAINKGITFYLWRYPSNRTIADGAPVTNNAKQFSYTLSAAQADQDTLTIGLADFANASGVPGFEFPKYDEKGYTYKYYATEVSKSELYKTVYWNSAEEFEGTSADKCVYDQGSICNVRNAKIAPGVTKYWSVSAVSDYVGSTCTFTLQRRENGEWVDKDTVILSGFSSSKKRVSGGFTSQELYDGLGQRYEYRVIESAVSSGSRADAAFDEEGWAAGATGSYSAVYTLNDYTYKAVSTYTSTVENGVESAEATVTNKLYGTKKLAITKNWTGAWNIGTETDKSGDITLQLKRAIETGSASLYATIVMKKPAAGASQGDVTVTYEETQQTQNITHTVTNDGKTWTMAEIEVPAYTEDGRQYVYSITETNVATPDPEVVYAKEYDRSVGGKKINLYITNRIGSTTVETRIDVSKIWKDDSDSSQRSDVKIEFGTYDDAHNFTPVSNAQGEPYVLILSASKDYSYYRFVDGARFSTGDETREEAISRHLAIRAFLKNTRTGAYDRVMEQCTYSADESGCVISGYIPAIIEDGFYRPGYKVTITRSANGRSFTITNTRAASRSFTFTKNWQDSANALGYRGDFLRVALFREVNDVEKEIALIDIPTYTDGTRTELTSGDGLTVTFTNGGQYYPAYDENGNNYIYSVKEYVCTGTPQSGETVFIDGAEPDAGSVEKKEISLSATKDTTTTGYVATREVSETQYSRIDGQYDLGASGVDSMLMTEGYTYTNTAAGERSEVPFYVIWHDGAKSNERPDIYLTLYYDGGPNGELITYTGTYTERWEDVEVGNKFIQKAIFSGLPAAAADGRVYTYYVAETFNNATSSYETEHYTDALRNSDDTGYNSAAVNEVTIGTDKQLIVVDGLPKDTVEVGGRKLTKEKSFTLTSISDEVKIEGRKLWLGIPDGIDVDKLPMAHIYLFRTSAFDETHKVPEVSVGATQEQKMAAYQSAAIPELEPGDGSASPQRLNDTKAMYIYGTYNTDGGVKSYAKFPKYDEMGYLYTYSVREVIYNTLGNKKELPADIMYPIYSDNTTDLSNQYKLDVNKNKRKFVVNKQWNITDSDYLTVHAKATFRLYRLELNDDGHGYEPLHYAHDDTSTSDPASSASAARAFGSLANTSLELLEEKTITSTDASITWDNYPIFAPSGKIYGYYVVELTADMPGYTVALNGLDPDNTTEQGSGAVTNNTEVSGGTMAAGDSYIGVAFANSGINLSESSETNKKTETFRNTYNPEGFSSITFIKEWDNKGFDGMLPTIDDAEAALKFSVYAIANTQSGKENKDTINFTEGTNYDVDVQLKDGNPSIWEYTITFKNGVVPIYSANGNLYTYYVRETLNSRFVKANYSAVTSLTYAKADTVNGSVLALPTHLKNALKGSFAVQKMWDDFSNDYGMREGSVTFDVYYRIGSGGNWTKLNADNSPYSLSASNKWKQTISGLPVTANASGACGDNYQYRVWEKEIKSGATVISVPSPSGSDPQNTDWEKNNHEVDSDKYFAPMTAGNYQVYNPKDMESISGSPTKKLANQLDTSRAVVSLDVTKTWDDSNDLYGIRPSSIWVTIQSSKDEGNTWEDVTTREITSANADPSNANVWKKSFENLPKYYDGSSTEHVYKYRAIEAKVGTKATTLSGLTGTGGSYSISHVVGEETDAVSGDVTFTTAVTNTLIPMDASIKVLKRWNSAAPQGEVKVALFSTNYTGGAAGTGTPTEISFTGNEKALNAGNSWTCEYQALPKYNKDGIAIVYYVKEKTTGSFKTQYLAGSGDWPTGTADDNLKYTSSEITSDFHVAIVNTPLTSIKVTKLWQDENNKYSLRPDSVQLTLQRRTAGTDEDWVSVTYDDAKRTGATVITKGSDNLAKVTVSKNNAWAAVTVDKLPLYALSDGTTTVKYQYRLAELTIPNAYTRNIGTEPAALLPNDGYEYGGTDSAQTSTVTNYLITRGDITVNKVWNTLSDAEKSQVTVKLYSGNLTTGADSAALREVPGATATISGSSWSYVFEDLPKYNKSGTAIVYYVDEAAVTGADTAYYVQNGSGGYTKVEKAAAKTSTVDAFEFRIVNTPLTSITGSKNWIDDNDGFGLRPASIDLTLQRRIGTGQWQDVSVEELRKTNTDTTVLPVVTVSAENGWQATIDSLPLYALSDGSAPARYQYRLAESSLPNGYTRDRNKEVAQLLDDDGYTYGTGAGGQTSAVSNYLILRSQPITVRKIWNTVEAGQKTPVEVKLLSRNFKNGTDSGTGALTVVKKGTESYIRTLNAAGNWESVFADLPLKNKDGQDIVYYISETAGAGFTTEYYVFDGNDFNKVSEQQVKTDGDTALLTQIVNTPKTSATVEKIWSDQENKFATRPASIYVKLQRKLTDETSWADVAGQAVVELNDANNWTETIENLALYAEYSGADPVRYEYRFIETDASGNPFVPLGYSLVSATSEYVMTCDGTEAGYVNAYASGAYSTAITNTLITKSITAIKKWEDDSDDQKIRPATITLFVDESGHYVLNNGVRCSSTNLSVTPQKSSDGNTWTYVFTGLPKYAYGAGASASNPAEIVYEVTEDVSYVYPPDGFVIQNYYVTDYEINGEVTTITNTAMESNGVLLVEKAIAAGSPVTSYAFPFTLSLLRPDNTTVAYTGKYYLYDASLGSEDIRTDVKAAEPQYPRTEMTTSDGVIRIPNGKVAALKGINSMYKYIITESPNHAGYEVASITGADTSNPRVADDDNGGYYGTAVGQIPASSAPAVRVVFTNQLIDFDSSTYLKVENVTDPATNSRGEVLTGGEVKVYRSNRVVDSDADIGTGGYDYVNTETPYIEQAMSVEFKPDTANGYSYSNHLTICWWNSGEDPSGDPHSVVITGYFYSDSNGQHPYTGKLSKDGQGEISVVEGSEQFAAAWTPLLENSPFKHITVLEGSIVVTLASQHSEMPPKTLVQVEFVPPAKPAPGHDDKDSDKDSQKKGNSNESGTTAAVATVPGTDNSDDQAGPDGSIQGVKTGDDTPLTALMILFVTFAFGFAAVLCMYMRKRSGKK